MALQAIMGDIAEGDQRPPDSEVRGLELGTAKFPNSPGDRSPMSRRTINETFNKLSVAGQSMTVSEDFMFELEDHGRGHGPAGRLRGGGR